VCKVIDVEPEGGLEVIAYQTKARETSTKCITAKWWYNKKIEASWITTAPVLSIFKKLSARGTLMAKQVAAIKADESFPVMQEQDKDGRE
jgi:hypothetical protein